MKITTACLFVFSVLFHFNISAQSNGSVWVTINNPENIPVVNIRGEWTSNDSTFNAYLQSLNISSVSQALPSSRRADLQKVYEIKCNCSQTVLESSLTNFVRAVSGVEQAPIYDTLHTPNDYTITAGINNYALNLINAQTAWDITKGDSNVVVGITDQDYFPLHSELVGKFVHLSSSNQTATHGTAVSIVAAGRTNNNNGLSSIGYNCKLGLYAMNFNEVLNAAYAGMKIINMSWTSGCFSNVYFQNCMNEAYETGAFLVAAAGNGVTCNNPTSYVYPASCDNVFSVTSVGFDDKHVNFYQPLTTHQHNDKVDLASPGYDVAICPAEGWYLNSTGTSFAAPYVSGTVGLMLSANPCLSRKDIDTILRISSVNIDSLNPQFVGLIGAGRLNAHAAVQLSLGWTTNPMTVVSHPSSTTAVVGGLAQFSVSSSSTFPVYRWQRDSSGTFVNLFNNNTYSGVSTNTLTVNNVGANFNNYQYRCVMSSGYCNATSNPATLNIVTGIIPGNVGVISGDTSICFGEISVFSVQPVLYANGYNWSVTGSNTTVISGQNTNTISVQSFDNSFQISVTAINTFGSSNTTTTTVSVLNLPTGSLNTQTSICAGDSTLLTINVTGNGIWNGTINNQIHFSGNSSPITVWVSPSTTTDYYLTFLESDGCNASPDGLISNSTVTVLSEIYDTTVLSICTGQLPYVWNNVSLTQSGTYYDTVINSVGCDSIKVLQLTVTTGNTPLAPATITQNLVSNNCNNRIYRYIASITNFATSYEWAFATTLGGQPAVIVDSGDINSSRIIRLKYTNNLPALLTDSIKVRAKNACGYGSNKTVKLIVTALLTPLVPASITVTPIVTNICGGRKYRYIAPNLPAAVANTTAATGYVWSFTQPLPLQATIDSGSLTSKIIVVKYSSNSSANLTDSIFLQYNSDCGLTNKKSLKIAVSALNPPIAPPSITIVPLVTNICGNRKYRFIMPQLPSATSTNGAATGYLWTLVGQLATFGLVDSGTLNSRIVVIKYTSDNNTFIGDSIKAQYQSNCGLSSFKSSKFSVPKLIPPLAPISITINAIQINVCSDRKFRYIAPNLPQGSVSTAAATGYLWDFVGNLSEYASIDSGDLNSQKVVVTFSINAAAISGDSVKLNYLSICGVGLPKMMKLSNTKLNAPSAPSTLTITALQTNICNARKYRYSAPNLPIATTTASAANGYLWDFKGNLQTTMTIDSGTLNSQKFTVTFTSNAAASILDSVRVLFTSAGCGNSIRKAAKLTNTFLGVPLAPLTISIAIKSNSCNARVYRYIAPASLPLATATTGAASGYLWSAPTGLVGSTGTIDSGVVSSKIITVKYTSNAAAGIGDSIRLRYTSGCGNGAIKAQKLSNLLNAGCRYSESFSLAKAKDESNVSNLQLFVSPNPTTTQFNLLVKSKSAEPIIVRLLDITGRFLKLIKITPNANLNIGSSLKPGVYFIEAKQGRETVSARVIKF